MRAVKSAGKLVTGEKSGKSCNRWKEWEKSAGKCLTGEKRGKICDFTYPFRLLTARCGSLLSQSIPTSSKIHPEKVFWTSFCHFTFYSERLLHVIWLSVPSFYRLTPDFIAERLGHSNFSELRELDLPHNSLRTVDLGTKDAFINLRR